MTKDREGPVRVTDERLREHAEFVEKNGPRSYSALHCLMGDEVTALVSEALEARERGLMPTVDLASQLTTNRVPVEMNEAKFIAMPGGGLSVNAYTPEPGGRGKTTQVHLVFDLAALGEELAGINVVHRMKSGPAVDQLIRLLAEYRGEVWPSYQGVRVGT